MNNLLTPNYPNGRNLFQGKNMLVTAAAGSGIGFSTARRFLEEGANVFISDVHEARLEQAIQTLQDLKLGEVDGCICNVTNDQEIDSMFKQALTRFSHLDGVINNAGLGGESSLESMTNGSMEPSNGCYFEWSNENYESSHTCLERYSRSNCK